MARLLYDGHASFRLIADNGYTVYIDPYMNTDVSKPADLVLITHEHFDHNNVGILQVNPSYVILRPLITQTDGDYRNFTLGNMKVQAVPAYNQNHRNNECVGYVIDVDGKKLYFAGDTSKTVCMSKNLAYMNLDYAFLPCDGKFNMDLEEAIECAKIIGAKHTVPIHTCPVSNGETPKFDEEKARSFKVPGAMVVLPGEEIVL